MYQRPFVARLGESKLEPLNALFGLIVDTDDGNPVVIALASFKVARLDEETSLAAFEVIARTPSDRLAGAHVESAKNVRLPDSLAIDGDFISGNITGNHCHEHRRLADGFLEF